jgi:hypothetical protein
MESREKTVNALKLVLESAVGREQAAARAGFAWVSGIATEDSANEGIYEMRSGLAHRRYRAKRDVKVQARRRTYQRNVKILRFEAISRNAACLLGSGPAYPTTSRLFPCAISFNPSHAGGV